MFGPRITWVLDDVSTSSPIQLYPSPDFTEKVIRDKQFSRTYGGRLHTFTTVNCYVEYSLPITWIGCGDCLIVNSWWRTQSSLLLTINGSVDTTVFPVYETIAAIPVKILNKVIPFQQNVEFRYSEFMGVILLGTTS